MRLTIDQKRKKLNISKVSNVELGYKKAEIECYYGIEYGLLTFGVQESINAVGR